MSASAALKAARDAGVRIGVDGGDLVLEAAIEPPRVVLEALSDNKAEIVALLSRYNRGGSPFADAFAKLERQCPDHIDVGRWQQCVDDARCFLSDWGEQSAALDWTTDDLFGLHEPPAKPHPSYSRLSRYDVTGILWLLEARAVVVITADTAAIQTSTGATLIYRRFNKPGLGPLGDSLDDFRI